jgi:16S rRNA pseudouridine516 synthase
MSLYRLDKIIKDALAVTRAEAARLIRAGRVTLGGALASDASVKCDPDTAVITVNGEIINYRRFHYLMMNKPAGVVSATEDAREATVTSLLTGEYSRLPIFPVGRLDKDTEGLLLLTDDGGFAHNATSPSKGITKTYFLRVDGVFITEDATAFERGVTLADGTVCRPAFLTILGDGGEALIQIHEGKYHQVKRMSAARGKRVTYLKRLSVGGLALDDKLAPGEYRELTNSEISSIFDAEPQKSFREFTKNGG